MNPIVAKQRKYYNDQPEPLRDIMKVYDYCGEEENVIPLHLDKCTHSSSLAVPVLKLHEKHNLSIEQVIELASLHPALNAPSRFIDIMGGFGIGLP